VSGRFADRTCLVTGAGRGIGRAIARALAHEGAQVGLVARTASQCESVAKEIGDQALAIPADVADANPVERAFNALEERTRRLSRTPRSEISSGSTTLRIRSTT
jgi:NAD(P)-dependent dehydrogenase (short-subunit alcohol dehydrogenase family)